MTSYEMVEKLSEKKGITLAQAKEVLEKCNWDILDAMIYLEKNPINTNAQQTAAGGAAQTTVNLNKEQPQGNAENVQTAYGIPNSNCGQQGAYSTPQGANGTQQTYTVPNGSQCESAKGVSFSEMLGRFFGFVGKVITKGLENSVIISKDEKEIANIPVIVMVLLLVFAFWIVVPIMVIGLFLNFRYSFSGASACKEKANEVMNKASKATEKIKNDFMNGVEYGGK